MEQFGLLLQWGRDSLVAEIRPRFVRPVIAMRYFNGAATR